MKLKQIFRKTFRVILPLLLGCLLLWYLYQGQDFGEMMEVAKKGVRYDILLFSLLFGLGGNIFRGLRWGLLIDSLGAHVKKKNVILAVLGNYAINMVLPRVGEIWRCGVTSKYEKIPFTRLIGTMLVDRVMDTVVVSLAFVIVFSFNLSFFSVYFSRNPEFVEGIYSMFSSVWMYAAILLFVAVVWFCMKKWEHLSFVKKIKDAILNIWEGIKCLWKLDRKALFVFQTLMIWGCYFLYFYITFYAFDFTCNSGIRTGLIVFLMGSIGVAVPIQGGIGVWHFMVISTLVTFGVSEVDAGAFALVVYTIQTVWTIITGLAGVFALPAVNRNRPADQISTGG
ncbi:MAG: flippase-like domain-containing protein [Tannerella sp.]|nr:flippase-like domain-containing protein [Tannerella sp.]